VPSTTPAADGRSAAPTIRRTSSVRVRIVAAFLAVVTVHLSVVVFLLAQLGAVTRAQTTLSEGYLPLSLQVDQMRGDLGRIERDLVRLEQGEDRRATGDRSSALVFAERLRESLLEARLYARRVGQLTKDPEEVAASHRAQAQLGAIEELVKRYQAESVALVRSSELGEPSEGLATRTAETGRLLAEEIDRLSSLLDDRIHALDAASHEARDRARALAAVMTAVTLLLALVSLLALLFALRPIGALTTHVQRLAQGERPARLDVRGTDEIALLASEFDRMVDAVEQRDQALRERAEELARLSRYLGNVLDTLSGGLFVVEGGAVTLANPAAGRLLGVHTGAPVPAELAPWAGTGGDAPTDRILVRPDGTEHEVRRVPFGDGGVIVWSIDVTDQRRAAERLATSERLALIGQMLAQITHEVRNPLNALSLNAEMLRDELERLDPAHGTEAWPLLGTVSGEIDRLTEVTAHYLQLARRPAARLEPEPPTELVAEVERLLRPELEAKGVTLRVEVPALPPVPLDGNQMRQVLLNLVRNAVEAGARTIVLGGALTDDEAVLSVRDDGGGMSPDEARRAFDPFFSTKPTGTGLGLAITRQVIEDHGGSIQVDSVAGVGTTFRIHLPRRGAR
jgi:nitrogen fixation/metabolism regulation signal transduction histidine kinase